MQFGARGNVKSFRWVPWPKLNDYILRIEACCTISEFVHTACIELEKLIPFDSAGFHSTLDARCLEGIGVLDDRVVKSYNDYYRMKQPGFVGPDGKHQDFDFLQSTTIIDWRRYRNVEYTTDFMLPNQMYKSLAHVLPTHQVTLSAQRSRRSPDFTDDDVAILDLLNSHVNNLYRLFSRRGDPPDPWLSIEGIVDRFHSLSQREAELCSLLARRQNTAEIATSLFISARTVEKHIEDIFAKLDVHSRDQLRKKLGIQ